VIEAEESAARPGAEVGVGSIEIRTDFVRVVLRDAPEDVFLERPTRVLEDVAGK
jgi:hypothetical protein